MSEILEATSIEKLNKSKPASKEQVQKHLELQYKGKKGVVLPPFLMKILMDADSEDPFILLWACCKALLEFNEPSAVMVDNEEEAEDEDDEPILASITFFCMVQFLFFVGLDKTKAYGNLDMLTATLEHFTAMVNESNKLQEAKVEKDAKKSKMGQDKLMDFTLCMVLNTSEPLPDDLEDENGDPITEHKTSYWCTRGS